MSTRRKSNSGDPRKRRKAQDAKRAAAEAARLTGDEPGVMDAEIEKHRAMRQDIARLRELLAPLVGTVDRSVHVFDRLGGPERAEAMAAAGRIAAAGGPDFSKMDSGADEYLRDIGAQRAGLEALEELARVVNDPMPGDPV